MVNVVRVVVYSSNGSDLVKTVDQHTLMIHVGKSQRANNRCHAVGTAPVFCCFEQGIDDFLVVNEIDKAESHFLYSVFAIDSIVDYSGDSADGPIISVCHK